MKLDFLGPDFLLETSTAKKLYHDVAEHLPVVDFHNHLSAADIRDDRRFSDMCALWVAEDRYKHRAMRLAGLDERYLTGDATPKEKFTAWCGILPYTVGNPLFHWSAMEMKRVFGQDELPDASNADEMWETCNELLSRAEFSNNAILRSFGVEILTTSNDILEDVSVHKEATKVSRMSVTPSLRADSAVACKTDAETLDEFLSFIDARIEAFAASGCRVADHALDNGFAYRKTSRERARVLFERRSGLSPEEEKELRSFMLSYLIRSYARHNWTLLLHIGAERWTSTRLRKVAGPAGGFASLGSPFSVRDLCNLLDEADCEGLLPRTALFTLNPADNESLATLTGSFSESGRQKIKFGPAWWYNDHLYGIEQNLEAVSAYSLLSGAPGMTTDSRTILSFSRHDYFRRILCNFIGNKVAKGQFPSDDAVLGKIVADVSYNNAKNWIYGK